MPRTTKERHAKGEKAMLQARKGTAGGLYQEEPEPPGHLAGDAARAFYISFSLASVSGLLFLVPSSVGRVGGQYQPEPVTSRDCVECVVRAQA